MSYATVKLTDGSEIYVSNAVPNTAGTNFGVSNDVLNTAATTITLFADTIVSDPKNVINFDLTTAGMLSATKRPGDVIDFQIKCANIFGQFNPPDQIASVVWTVEYGSVTLSNERVLGTDRALVRVTGGGRLYSWHNIRATITCVSGQVYTPLIELQLAR